MVMAARTAYQRTQTETASKERILVLLCQRCMKAIGAAAEELARLEEAPPASAVSSSPAASATVRPHLQRAIDIVAELQRTLDPRQGEITTHLDDLYTFVIGRLFRASNPATPLAERARCVDEARRVFEPIASGFEQAVATLSAQPRRP